MKKKNISYFYLDKTIFVYLYLNRFTFCTFCLYLDDFYFIYPYLYPDVFFLSEHNTALFIVRHRRRRRLYNIVMYNYWPRAHSATDVFLVLFLFLDYPLTYFTNPDFACWFFARWFPTAKTMRRTKKQFAHNVRLNYTYRVYILRGLRHVRSPPFVLARSAVCA